MVARLRPAIPRTVKSADAILISDLITRNRRGGRHVARVYSGRVWCAPHGGFGPALRRQSALAGGDQPGRGPRNEGPVPRAAPQVPPREQPFLVPSRPPWRPP